MEGTSVADLVEDGLSPLIEVVVVRGSTGSCVC